MKRLEIIANRSVQQDIVEGLEAAIDNFFYTLLPTVHGRGRRQRRMGTPIWPEENFLLIGYVDDAAAETAARTMARIKKDFPDDGIKLFVVPAETI
jgi:hypothetical protein